MFRYGAFGGILASLAVASCDTVGSKDVPASPTNEMIHLVYYYSGDGSLQRSSSENAYELWKGDDEKERLQTPHRADSIQIVVIENKTDGWVITLPKNDVSHRAHPPGPLRSPIFQLRGLSAEVWLLDFGQELAFFKEHQARFTQTSDGAQEQVQLGTTTLVLSLGEDGSPREIDATAPGVSASVHYITFETGLREAPQLFRPPDGATIRESPGYILNNPAP